MAELNTAVNGEVFGTDVVTDAAGNTYMAGYLTVEDGTGVGGPIDLDPARTYADSRDIIAAESATRAFFAKYLTDGSLDWVNVAEGTSGFGGVKIAVAPATGGIYFAGVFGPSLQFSPTSPRDIGSITLTGIAGNDRFAGKFNADGTVAWAKAFSLSWDDRQTSGIAVDEGRGSLYVTGYQLSGSPIRQNGVVVALNISDPANVQVDWSASPSLVASSNSWVPEASVGSAVVDSAGNVISLVTIAGTADFDPGSGKVSLSSSAGSMLGVIWKLSGSGAFVDAQQFEPANNSGYILADIAIDASDNIYVAGSFNGTVDFQRGKSTLKLTSPGGIDAFFAKMSASGSTLFAQRYGGATRDDAAAIALDASGVYLTGYTRDSSGTYSNSFVEKFDQVTGELQWQFLLYGTMRPSGVAVSPLNGQVRVVGAFWSVDTDGDGIPDQFSTGTNSDMFWFVLEQA